MLWGPSQVSRRVTAGNTVRISGDGNLKKPRLPNKAGMGCPPFFKNGFCGGPEFETASVDQRGRKSTRGLVNFRAWVLDVRQRCLCQGEPPGQLSSRGGGRNQGHRRLRMRQKGPRAYPPLVAFEVQNSPLNWCYLGGGGGGGWLQVGWGGRPRSVSRAFEPI